MNVPNIVTNYKLVSKSGKGKINKRKVDDAFFPKVLFLVASPLNVSRKLQLRPQKEMANLYEFIRVNRSENADDFIKQEWGGSTPLGTK